MTGHAKKLRLLGVIPGADESTVMWFSRRQMATIGPYGILGKSFFLRSRTSPRIILREMRRLRHEIETFQPDVVHAHFGTMTAFVCTLVSPVPVVITYHGQDINPSPGDPWLRTKLAHTLSHVSARRAAQIVCVSEPLRRRVAWHRRPVHVIPCGVNIDLFRPHSKDACRDKLGWARDENVVVFNSGSDPVRKRIDLAQDAFAYARKKLPNLRLHVFDGKTHPDDMPLYFSAADALIVASDYEGSPMVVKEAMACNLPIVSVDVGDVVDRLAEVSPSAIVDRNPVALGEALVEIVGLGRRSNGREKVLGLSEQAVAQKLTDVYRLAAQTGKSERACRREEESSDLWQDKTRMQAA